MPFNLTTWARPRDVQIRHHKSPFSSLQDDINQTFENFFSGFAAANLLPSVMQNGDFLAPAIDIIENENNFKVEAEMPGMEMDDIDITLNDSYLTIKGEKKSYKEDKDENYVRRERYYGNYQRMIALPETADAEKAKATFKKGVLWIEIPKKPEAVTAARKLKITAPD